MLDGELPSRATATGRRLVLYGPRGPRAAAGLAAKTELQWANTAAVGGVLAVVVGDVGVGAGFELVDVRDAAAVAVGAVGVEGV